MEDNTESALPKRVVRTITLTQDDLSLLDGIERDVKDRAENQDRFQAHQSRYSVAHATLHDKAYDVMEVAERVVKEDGHLEPIVGKRKKNQ